MALSSKRKLFSALFSAIILSPLSSKSEEVPNQPIPVPLETSPTPDPTQTTPNHFTRGWMSEIPFNAGIRNKDCDMFLNPRSQACIGTDPGVQPKNNTERVLMGAGMFAVSDGSAMLANPTKYFQSKGTNWAISQANTAMNMQLRKIPFFAQTTLGMDLSTGSGASFYLDSFMKLATFDKDSKGAPKGIVFGQARYAGTTATDGSTLNGGLGVRYRLNDETMVGVNGFWDYRMTTYTSPYTRFGIGEEIVWKDFELRNNWYISGSNTRVIAEDAGSITYERVVPGWDVELGYRLPSYPQLAFYVKGFNWYYDSRPNNSGIGGTVNWQATPHVNLEASVSNEVPAYLSYATANNSDVFLGLKVKYTVGAVEYKTRDYRQSTITGMTQPVRRRYDVLLERYTQSKSTGWTVLVTSK